VKEEASGIGAELVEGEVNGGPRMKVKDNLSHEEALPARRTAPVMRRPVVAGSRQQRSEERPLTLAEQRARARWRKPVVAIIADALASNHGLLERLARGIYAPDMKHKEQYQVIFDGLYQTTREQIAALEMFSQVDWGG
jgi:hypothetical protein